MAFGGFGNPPTAMNSGAGGAGGAVTQGADLEVIQTESLGFLSIAGDAKVQLTPKWSPEPAATASLLSIAPRKGLVAAAGPEAVYIATTESVRKAFESPKNGDSEARPFEAQAKLPLPIRISQLAFTADEKYLILSAETGGGLAVYEVQSLTQGSTQAAFELNTNGETLRQLAPNPMPELSGYCAIVTNNGNLMMANLQDRTLVSGANGPTLRAQVTCAAWSSKGKQLIAGGADGSIHQMTPDGTEKGHIPKPPSLGDYHVSSVTWLENNVFLVVHNVANGQQPAVYHIITRTAGSQPSFTFQKLTDPVEPFGSDKLPHHSILRLRNFPPNLDDLLIVSSTATDSIGLLSRSKTPLDGGKPADKITNVFTTTELADDSKRAQLPMSDELMDTYAIGFSLDLSSKDKVYKPIPADEIEQSPGPLPGLWALNNEGVLTAWWIVYNDSIRAGTTYSGFPGATEGAATPQSAKPTPSAFGTPSTTAPAFGSPSAFGAKAPATSPWSSGAGTAAAQPAFGSTAFGGAPAANAPSLGASPFGSSAFGAKPAASAFGQPSGLGGLGARASPWATGTTAAVNPAFGQSGFAAASAPSQGKVFGSATTGSQQASGGFAGFASKAGFASLGANNTSQSIFGKPSGSAPPSAPEVSMDSDTSFPVPTSKPQGGSTFGSSPFVLGTTFKADPKTANDNELPKPDGGGSLFDSGFGLSLGDSSKPAPSTEGAKDEDMDVATPAKVDTKPRSIFSIESTTPTTTPAPQKFGLQTSGPTTTGSGLFGLKPSSNPFGGLFGPAKPAATPQPSSLQEAATETPIVKREEEEDKENLSDIPAAPLPPDTTSKAAYPLGDSSSSSAGSAFSPLTVSKTPPKVVDDAPLPPDFTSKPPAPEVRDTALPESPGERPAVPEAAPLPPDPFPTTSTKPAAKPSTLNVPGGAGDAPLPPDFLPSRLPSQKPPTPIPSVPESSEGELSEEEVESEGGEGDDEEGDQGTEVASEGSGVDVAKDLSPSTAERSTRTPGFTPQSSFAGMGGSTFSSFSRPEQDVPRTLFGEVSRNAPPLFPKPVPQSPRSPSPVRGAIPPKLFRMEQSRSVSAPGVASQILGRKPPNQQNQQNQSMFGRPSPQAFSVDPNVEQQRRLQAKKDAEAAQVLVDPEDEGIQQILRSEIEPTPDLNEFVAVESQLPAVSGSDIEAGCELLWRDINRMVDHLGLNSRSLQAFIKGHSKRDEEHGRTKEDLEYPDDWLIVEAEDLSSIVEEDLAQELEEGRVQDIEETEEAIRAISRDLSKLRAKEEDMRLLIMSHVDPSHIAVSKSLPLSAEQSTQQNELRRAYANFTKQLSEAEQSLTLLRAKIASSGGASSRANVPTVEAVIRTINKLTGMAEKRSADIDVLENHMRKLRLGSVGSPGPRSREGSPFVPGTPQQRRSMLLSPEATRNSFTSSVASYGMRGTPPRKKMSMYSEEERKVVRQKQTRRQAMLGMLRSSLEQSGPNISHLGDDD